MNVNNISMKVFQDYCRLSEVTCMFIVTTLTIGIDLKLYFVVIVVVVVVVDDDDDDAEGWFQIRIFHIKNYSRRAIILSLPC